MKKREGFELIMEVCFPNPPRPPASQSILHSKALAAGGEAGGRGEGEEGK